MNARMVSLGAFALAAGIFGLDAAGGHEASAGGGGCHERTTTEGAGTEVKIDENGCFSPTVLRVEPGEEVTFENVQGATHDVSGLSWGMWQGPDTELTLGESFVHTFSQPGYYPYSCTLHYNMVGLVIVGEPGDGNGGVGYAAPEPTSDAGTDDDQVAAEVAADGGGSAVPPWAVLTGAGVVALGLVGGGALLRARRAVADGSTT